MPAATTTAARTPSRRRRPYLTAEYIAIGIAASSGSGPSVRREAVTTCTSAARATTAITTSGNRRRNSNAPAMTEATSASRTLGQLNVYSASTPAATSPSKTVDRQRLRTELDPGDNFVDRHP